MVQSAAFNHMSDLSSTCFYGVAKKLEFAITRQEQRNFEAPSTSDTRISLSRKTQVPNRCICLNRTCTGSTTDFVHQRSVHRHIGHSETICFPSIYDIVREQEHFGVNADTETEHLDIPIPRHARPLIPSENAFNIDRDINKNSRNNCSVLLKAANTCHRGCSIYESSSYVIAVTNLRIETSRCFVNYQQETWTCQNGNCVTPEESFDTREGINWILRDTAFTEVFLFDLMVHMALRGTITGQSDLHSQLMLLQTNYASRQEGPRSNQCARKALISYAMALVKAIPNWVFRCNNCSSPVNGSIYYDKLSFDGQQLGFSKKKDVRYDFYGRTATPCRRPVERCSDAPREAMIIICKPLRGIVMEVLRARFIPNNCSSVQALCRKLFTVPLRSKDTIRAAVAAVKLFDPLWTTHMPPGMSTTIDATLDSFMQIADDENSVHPFTFLSELSDQHDFERCVSVKKVFSVVLDCSRAAAVIAILINELRNDLKEHITVHEKQFILNYSTWANNFIHCWLQKVSSSETTRSALSSQYHKDLHDELSTGMEEHAEFLHHPYRPPFAWRRSNGNPFSQLSAKLLCSVRNISEWTPPSTAQSSVLLLIIALFIEPVTVWIRDGDLAAAGAAEEVLINAELYAGESNTSYHYGVSLRYIALVFFMKV